MTIHQQDRLMADKRPNVDKSHIYHYQQHEGESLDDYYDRVIDDSFENMGWDDMQTDTPPKPD